MKEDGIKRVSTSPEARAWLELARFKAGIAAAYQGGVVKGVVTVDDIRGTIPEPPSPNLWGAVFRVGFEFTGEFRKSSHASNHARVNRVWRVK